MADRHAYITGLLEGYVSRQLARANPTRTAESLGYYLAGTRVTNAYRPDAVTESERTFISREYLRGIIADTNV